MRRRVPSTILAAVMTASVAALLSAQAPAPPTSTSPVTFDRDIQPILEKSCWGCHSADLKLADLDLSTREGALKGGEHGAALVPGSAERSKLYRMVAGLDVPAMPMEGEALKPAELAAIKTWIDQGAQWESSAAAAPKAAPAPSSALAALENMEITPQQRNYWAFKLPVQSAIPQVASPDLVNPVDRFLESERAKKGIMSAPRADRRTLIRRAYLDLSGLPPTRAQVKAFIEDKSHDAWEQRHR